MSGFRLKFVTRGRSEGFAFGSVCLSVCLSQSVRAYNSNTINPIDLEFLHKEESARSSVLLEFGLDPDLDSRFF
jgi:hypothetical protein